MQTLSRGWSLTMMSLAVLRADTRLAVFSVLSAVCTGAALALFAIPVLVWRGPAGMVADTRGLDPLWLALLFNLYLVSSLIAVFFNTALAGVALARLRGEDATVADGFRLALDNLTAIMVYALLSATVGTVLAVVAGRFKLVGEMVRSLIGAAWAIVTFLVVPVIVAEGRNAPAAIRRSGELLRRTWGEQLAGNGGIGLVILLLMLPAAIPLVLGVAAGSAVLLIVGIAVAVVYVAALAVVGAALSQIFRAALYLYATTSEAPARFDAALLRTAFQAKGSQ